MTAPQADQTYDIFFRGEALDGFADTAVRANFCKLFKTTDEKASAFFSGKVVALKRNIDKPTAAKLQATLKKAGLKIYIKVHAAAVVTEKPAPQPAASIKPTPSASPAAATIELAPAGTDVLKPDERPHIDALDVDTSAIHLASQFDVPAAEATPPRPEIDTSALSTAAPGADLLEGHHAPAPPPAPDTQHIQLDDSGAPLNIDHIDIPLPEPDTSMLTLAEPGADLEPLKPSKAPPPPATDHIKLDDQA
ncbi:Uncharacterised protein [BD1-7 clade bacterium]|uniref:Uncharacterized protein n=1 Tax=BD1-7 clade bacterium TaxID=2029982 RepID=A0A5S9QID9_9GAMM|nr:Uncharacterised protein [BD1-7 clade bacterium]CAA0117863.1 Uncharacterised protein [BD1-7 clade bacterium]